MNRLTRIGVAAALAAVSAVAISQAPPGAGGPGGPGAGPGGPPNPEAQAKAAIETRQAVFKLISNQNGPVGGAARAPTLDLAVIARNAARVQTLADIIPELFTANPTAPAGVKTRAKAEIWTAAADFKTKAEALSKAAGAVAAAAKSGDVAATKAAAAEVGKACGACHDAYRGPVVP